MNDSVIFLRKQIVSGTALVVLVALTLPFAADATKLTTATFPAQAYTGVNVANDGWTSLGGGNWSVVRSALVADQFHNADDGFNGVNRLSGALWFGNYYVQRAHFVFDTSVLPQNAVIDSASVIINVADGNYASLTSGIYIVGSSQPGDYTAAETYSAVGSNDFGHALISQGGVYEISLNQDGINALSLGGVTKLAARTWHDFNNIVPLSEIGAGLEGDDFYVTSAEGNPSLAPRLVVTWHKGKNIEKKEKKERNEKHESKEEKKESYPRWH